MSDTVEPSDVEPEYDLDPESCAGDPVPDPWDLPENVGRPSPDNDEPARLEA